MLKTVRQSWFFARAGTKDSSAGSRAIARSSGNSQSDLRHLSVAVIGAGAAGLVAARELRREGHSVTVYEQGDQVGGVWVYTDAVEAEDLLGLKGSRQKVHGSLYESLRTNLPRHVMAYTDFPFDSHVTGSEDRRLFCGHEEVLRYLQKFDAAFGISQMVQFNTRVIEATPLNNQQAEAASLGPKWRLRLEPANDSSAQGDSQKDAQRLAERDFDALVVCNGHYSEPRVPELPGRDAFPGRLLHTHNFRENSGFAGQRVVVMGASASGQDIAREIAAVADKVYFSARPMSFGKKVLNWEASDEPFGPRLNMVRRAAIESLGQDGSVTFRDGLKADGIDAVVFATGYKFAFPFLDASKVVTVEDNRVSPLYQHVVCTTHASLAFIGLPWQVIPFPLMELQSKWVARCLSGRSQLPSRAAMEEHTAEFYRRREAEGLPVRYSHRLGEEQWGYNAWLVDQIGQDQEPLPDWRRQMHLAGQQNIRERPDSYRDSYPATDLVATAESIAAEQRQVVVAA